MVATIFQPASHALTPAPHDQPPNRGNPAPGIGKTATFTAMADRIENN